MMMPFTHFIPPGAGNTRWGRREFVRITDSPPGAKSANRSAAPRTRQSGRQFRTCGRGRIAADGSLLSRAPFNPRSIALTERLAATVLRQSSTQRRTQFNGETAMTCLITIEGKQAGRCSQLGNRTLAGGREPAREIQITDPRVFADALPHPQESRATRYR
jgi:hypothetical protein